MLLRIFIHCFVFSFFFIPVHSFSNIQFGIPHDLVICKSVIMKYILNTLLLLQSHFLMEKNSFVIVSVTMNNFLAAIHV